MQKQPHSVRQSIFSINLSAVSITLVLAFVSTLILGIWMTYQSLDEKLMNSALMISQFPEVASSMEQGTASPKLEDFLEKSIKNIADIDVVVVAGQDGTQLYHPDPAQVGLPYSGKEQDRLLRDASPFLADDTSPLGTERCAFVPILDKQGSLAGFIMVGIYLRSLTSIVLRIVLQYLALAVCCGILALFLSSKLLGRIKRSLLGHEPDAFLALFQQREEILDALEEGILAIDRDSKVVYLNRMARELIGLDGSDPIGKKASEVCPGGMLSRVLHTKKPEYNADLSTTFGRPMLVSRLPVTENGKLVGAVAILRDRTEVTNLAERLTGVGHMVEAMRAYTHEFTNKLHVVLGLLELEEYDEATRYIADTARIQKEAISAITTRIDDPSVAALLVGKTSRASELGIRLVLEPGSQLSADGAMLPSEAYITILGNLIENAMEALNQTSRTPKEITVGIREDHLGLLLTVDDTGPGMSQEAAKHVFSRGFSTKGDGRGTGLSLVKEVADAYGGEIRVESSPGEGASFIVWFGHSGKEPIQ